MAKSNVNRSATYRSNTSQLVHRSKYIVAGGSIRQDKPKTYEQQISDMRRKIADLLAEAARLRERYESASNEYELAKRVTWLRQINTKLALVERYQSKIRLVSLLVPNYCDGTIHTPESKRKVKKGTTMRKILAREGQEKYQAQLDEVERELSLDHSKLQNQNNKPRPV